MKTKFTLKNFRVFDANEGGTFQISPITILTGCNSSGKSSLVKSLLLLKNFFNELLFNDVHNCKLDFSNSSAKLGRFDLARNKNSRKDSKMYFSYTITPPKFKEELCVELWFSSNNIDHLNNGWLDHFIVSTASDKKVLIDASYKRLDNGKVELYIKKIDLNVIINCHLLYVYNDLIHEESTFAALCNTQGKDKHINNINIYLKGLGKYLTNTELDNVINDVYDWMNSYNLPYESGFNGSVYTLAADLGTILPLPILSKLKGVKKQNVRETINACIYEKTFSYHQLLDSVISAFESSRYNDFISYYKAKEREGLVFRDLKQEFNSTDIRILAYDNAKEYNIVSRIDSLSNLLNLSKYSIAHCTDGVSWSNERETINPASFKVIYSVMSEVSEAMNKDDYNRFVEEHYVINNQYYDEHKVFTDICKFFDSIISCVLSPKDLKSFMYVGDSDIEIKRIYTIENNNEMSRLLTKYFEACTNNQNKKFNPGELINKWVKAFCIGERVTIEMSSDGYGVMLRLFKDEKDKNGNLLVDEGFGITKLIATLINIEYAILTSDSNIAIEEPENHLHPKYQSLLADMFVDVYKNYGINFIIETHSEYLVRKLQTLVAKKELTAEEVSLQYVYDAKTENRPKGEPHVKSIGIRPDGTLQTSFGPGFFDEADNLAMDLLTIKAMS